MKVQYYPTHKIVIVSSSNNDNLISFHNCIRLPHLTFCSSKDIKQFTEHQ